MTRDELLHEGVAAKLIRYAKIDSQSDDTAEGVPSTPGQRELAELLRQELVTLGLAEVRVDEHGFVLGTLPANTPGKAPIIGLLAHMDTAVGIPSRNIKPQVIHYQGGDLHLPHLVVTEADDPALKLVAGHDLVTSDGATLLGADDKAGVAEIMEVLCRLITDPSLPHGEVKIAFTPDEEIGRGIEYLDPKHFGADFAYTLDGGLAGELEGENFNALNLTVTVTGISAHTGDARGKMVNAVELAAELIAGIPANMRPETTMDREGFIHADTIQGNVEEVQVKVLIRDFTEEGLKAKESLLRNLECLLEQKYPGAKAGHQVKGSYQNMKSVLDKDPRVIDLAAKAMENAGIKPEYRAIRGGTDGARLCQMGLPTPNLFTGGNNFHSRKEWASVQWMEGTVQVVLNLLALWSREKK